MSAKDKLYNVIQSILQFPDNSNMFEKKRIPFNSGSIMTNRYQEFGFKAIDTAAENKTINLPAPPPKKEININTEELEITNFEELKDDE